MGSWILIRMKTYAGPKHCLSVCVTVKIWPESGHGGTGTTPSGEDQHPDRLVEALDQDSMEVSTGYNATTSG